MEDEYERENILQTAIGKLPVPIFFDLHVPGAMAISDPDSFSTRIEDFERFLPAPRRTVASVHHETLESLAEYLTEFGLIDTTRVFASLSNRIFHGIIDYHQPDPAGAKPSHREHHTTFETKFDQSFKAWLDIDGKWLSQRQFAHFLQDRADDAVKPEPADLIEIAENFSAIRRVEFDSRVSMHDGTRTFNYKTTDDTKTKGSVDMVKMIALDTPVFYGEGSTHWVARFDYEIGDNGALNFRATIHRKDQLIDVEFQKMVNRLSSLIPFPIFRASAPI